MQTGDIIAGKYEILREIGKGGMGAVYEARHVQLGRRLALKFLKQELTSNPEAVARFMREAQAAASIGSDHIVDVLDIGDTPQGTPYLVMEYLEGADLRTILTNQGQIQPDRAATLVAQVCRGVQAAHNQGIVHRDLKPANVFVIRTDDGSERVKILDFGVAMFRTVVDEQTPRLTATGSILGTPYYMAPEQAKGQKTVDHRVDVYAAGVVLYELVAGKPPFEGETYNALIVQIATSTPAPLRQLRPDLSDAFDAVVSKAMAREIDDRYPSMQALAEALAPFGTNPALSVGVATAQGALQPVAGLQNGFSQGPAQLLDSGPATGGMQPAQAAMPAGVPQTAAPPPTTMGQSVGAVAPAAPITPGAGIAPNSMNLSGVQEPKRNKGLIIGIIALAALFVGGVAAVTAYFAIKGMRSSSSSTQLVVTTNPATDGGVTKALPDGGNAALQAVNAASGQPDALVVVTPQNMDASPPPPEPTKTEPLDTNTGPTKTDTAKTKTKTKTVVAKEPPPPPPTPAAIAYADARRQARANNFRGCINSLRNAQKSADVIALNIKCHDRAVGRAKACQLAQRCSGMRWCQRFLLRNCR